MARDKVTRELRETSKKRKDRSRKRKQSFNPKTAETDESTFSTAAKKLKQQEEVIVPQDDSIQYRIINFITVFAAISEIVKCRKCNGNVKFQTESTRGLGFKIAVLCDNCPILSVPSCSFIGHTYEINRRFIFVMRLLGLGYEGCVKFCGLMDMPKFLSYNTYNLIVKNMLISVKEVVEKLFKKAVKEEKDETAAGMNSENENELTVSGDGTWQKRGYTSLYGVSSIIGYYSGKVLDVEVKSAYCKMCEPWKNKSDTEEYVEFWENHQNECSANHEGSAGKMEVAAIIEMFKRSTENHDVKYVNYIGDRDSKTYSGVRDAFPYGPGTIIKKKECIGHVQKRMGSRLRECKKKTRGLGGRGKLTGKLIDKLTVYYGLAIRRNCDSVDKMRCAIWATFYHYNYKHDKCPVGSDSWCTWQRAAADGKLDSFKHDYQRFPDDVSKAVKPIYTDLSKQELLERCVGGFTQNNNESYNQLIWKICLKILPSSNTIVQLAAYIAACLFNEGFSSILMIFQSMGVPSGPNAHDFAAVKDKRRISVAEDRARAATREERMRRRQHQIETLEAAMDAEGLLYGPGIDDSV